MKNNLVEQRKVIAEQAAQIKALRDEIKTLKMTLITMLVDLSETDNTGGNNGVEKG